MRFIIISRELGGAIGLNRPNAPVVFHFGIQHRLATASRGTDYFGLQATYPFLRAEWSAIYITAGATPLIWKRAMRESGIDNFNQMAGSLAILAELGFAFFITPEVSFLAGATGQALRSPAGAGPYVLDVTVGFRFFYGTYEKTRDRRPFDGFRYPKGWQR